VSVLRSQCDRIVGSMFALVGVILILGVAVRTGEMRFGQDRLSLLMSGGVGGLAAVCVGAGLLLSARFHDNWRRLDELERSLRGPVRDEDAAKRGLRNESGFRRPGPLPWLKAQGDRAVGFVLLLAGAGLLGAGIGNVSQSLYETEQVAFIASAGIGALLLVVLGLAALLSADLEDEDRKVDRIEAIAAGEALLRPRDALRLAGEGRAVVPNSGPAPGKPKRVIVLLSAGLTADLLLIVVGWAKAAGAVELRPAVTGLAIATVGLLVAIAELASVIYRRRLRIDRRVTAVHRRVEDPGAELLVEGEASDCWTAEGLSLFHRSACAVLKNPGLRFRAVGAADAGQLRPCLLCCAADENPVPALEPVRADRAEVTNHA